jgi:drug/metabolite transporter (DMT)-like permease
MTARSLILLLLLGAAWGASFLFIKVVVDEASPWVVAEGRILFGALALAPIIALRRSHVARLRPMLPQVAIVAVFGSVLPFLLISWAEIHIESGIASVLNSTMPLFTGLFAAIFLMDERLDMSRSLGLLLGFVGVVVMRGRAIADVTDSAALGQLAVVSASASYGATGVFIRSRFRDQDALTLSGFQLAIGFLLTTPFFLAVGGASDLGLSEKAWLSLLTLGIVNTGLAYIVYYWLIANTGSVRASLVAYIIPVVGLILGAAVLDESFSSSALLGSALIVASIAAAAGAPNLILARLRLRRPASSPAQQPLADAEAIEGASVDRNGV